MNKKEYLIGLLITMTLFAAFVYFFIEPSYGPQITYEDLETEDPNSSQDGEEQESENNAETNGMNPDYANLTDEQISIADIVIADLLNSGEGITPPMVTVVSFEEREFSDASLGCPQEGETYAQVITPGYQVILEAQGEEYDYRISGDTENVILCNSN